MKIFARCMAALPLVVTIAYGQCVMCFRNAAAQNAARAELFNWAILVMLVPPLAVIGWIVWLAWRRNLPRT